MIRKMMRVYIVLLFVVVNTGASLAQCKRGEVLCKGKCIHKYSVCNKEKLCAPNQFECTNHKCIKKTQLCDSKDDCGDNSDEFNCPTDINAICLSSEFEYDETQCIGKSRHCDGAFDCLNHADEIGCRSSNITNVSDGQALTPGQLLELICEADGVPVPIISWSLDSGHLPAQCTTSPKNGVGKLTCPNIKHQHKGTYSCEALGRNISKTLYEEHCILPFNPANGKYTVLGGSSVHVYHIYLYSIYIISIKPVFLNYTCNAGYKLIGSSSVYCSEGWWSADFPKCVSQCPLSKHPSIVYWCLAKGPLISMGEDQECEELVPDGAIVRPEGRKPGYHYTGGFLHSTTRSPCDVLTLMTCVDGTWNYIPTCSFCGLVRAKSFIKPFVINGTSAVRGELPWHAAIYTKTTKPFKQICGGSLISNTVIISAAHCFWSDLDKQIPAANFSAALGKLYRPWNDTFDFDDVQKFNIREIRIPPRFHGARTNFQDDLAVVILASTVVYTANVLPVCVDFDANLERRQLTSGKSGKFAGWGLTSAGGVESPVLKVTKLPFIDIVRCFDDSPLSFHSYITSDKFCAGYFNSTGSALCRGDSGGGLAFSSRKQDTRLYYLRGVASTAAATNNNDACNIFVYTTFTQISKFKSFIQDSINKDIRNSNIL